MKLDECTEKCLIMIIVVIALKQDEALCLNEVVSEALQFYNLFDFGLIWHTWIRMNKSTLWILMYLFNGMLFIKTPIR